MLKKIYFTLSIFLLLMSCLERKVNLASDPLKNKSVFLDIPRYDEYTSLFLNFIYEIMENYDLYNKEDRPPNIWENMIEDFWKILKPSHGNELTTGFNMDGTKGKLNEENWNEALKALEILTRDLHDGYFYPLELFGKKIINFNPRDRLYCPSGEEKGYFSSSNKAFNKLEQIEITSEDNNSFFSGVFPEEKILYFHLSAFNPYMSQRNSLYINFINKATSGEYKKIILDLRSSKGRSIEEGYLFLSYFFGSDQQIAYGKRKTHSTPIGYKTIYFNPYDFAPLNFKKKVPSSSEIVILCDKNTEEMAEILIMVLRERKNTKVVGEQTRGTWGEVLAREDHEAREEGGKRFIQLINPHNNQAILKWVMGKGTNNRSLRDEKESIGLRADIEVKFEGGIRDEKNKFLIISIDKDPQLEKAKELLKK